MENESRSDTSRKVGNDTRHNSKISHLISKRSLRVTLPVAAFIGSVTIGALVLVLGDLGLQSDSTGFVQQAMRTVNGQVSVDRRQNADKTIVDSIDEKVLAVSQAVLLSTEAISEQVSKGFEALALERTNTKQALTSFGESVRDIRESLVELREENNVLSERIHNAQSSLQAIARDVRVLKVAQKKRPAAQRKQATSRPPFDVDAIDIWDDSVYVAISQNGQVAFLREGEQRSGWIVTQIDRPRGRVEFHGPQDQPFVASIRN
jgi:hypothetical protein